MTEKPPYSSGRYGPTLLFIFQAYVLRGATPEAAKARLDGEVKSGEIEANPPLKPGSRFELKQGLRHPCLIVDAVNHTKTASETEFYYGPLRLDVVDVDGTRTGAENFHGCPRATGPMVPPAPFEPPWVSKLIASVAGKTPVEPVDPMAVKRQRKSDIVEWLLTNDIRWNSEGKQVLSADHRVYWDECHKKFPSATIGELKRALLVARKRLGLVQSRSK